MGEVGANSEIQPHQDQILLKTFSDEKAIHIDSAYMRARKNNRKRRKAEVGIKKEASFAKASAGQGSGERASKKGEGRIKKRTFDVRGLISAKGNPPYAEASAAAKALA